MGNINLFTVDVESVGGYVVVVVDVDGFIE